MYELMDIFMTVFLPLIGILLIFLSFKFALLPLYNHLRLRKIEKEVSTAKDEEEYEENDDVEHDVKMQELEIRSQLIQDAVDFENSSNEEKDAFDLEALSSLELFSSVMDSSKSQDEREKTIKQINNIDLLGKILDSNPGQYLYEVALEQYSFIKYGKSCKYIFRPVCLKCDQPLIKVFSSGSGGWQFGPIGCKYCDANMKYSIEDDSLKLTIAASRPGESFQRTEAIFQKQTNTHYSS